MSWEGSFAGSIYTVFSPLHFFLFKISIYVALCRGAYCEEIPKVNVKLVLSPPVSRSFVFPQSSSLFVSSFYRRHHHYILLIVIINRGLEPPNRIQIALRKISTCDCYWPGSAPCCGSCQSASDVRPCCSPHALCCRAPAHCAPPMSAYGDDSVHFCAAHGRREMRIYSVTNYTYDIWLNMTEYCRKHIPSVRFPAIVSWSCDARHLDDRLLRRGHAPSVECRWKAFKNNHTFKYTC